jgi:catalase
MDTPTRISRSVLLTALCTAGPVACTVDVTPRGAAATRPSAGPGAGASSDVDVQIVDALQKRYGVHPGFRSNHAKGIIADGRFTPTPRAAELSRSPLFAGATLPVTVRFSDASGLPNLPDASASARPHGLSIKFHLPNGQDSDIVTNTLKFFTVATPEDFRDLQLAAATNPPGGPRSEQFEAFLKSHPSVERANATVGTPDSFADEQYFGIDAFIFVDRFGTRQPIGYVIVPEHVVHLSATGAARQSPGYLVDELPTRLARASMTFHLRAQLAAPGDPTNDATQAWPGDRSAVGLGILTIERVVPDSDAVQRKLLFTPGRLTDGIEPSDDPLIAARDGSYAESFRRRNPAAGAGPEFKREAAERARADREAVSRGRAGVPTNGASK